MSHSKGSWCGYCDCRVFDHQEKHCRFRTNVAVMERMKARFEGLRPFPGYEFRHNGVRFARAGGLQFFITCKSSGINWFPERLNANYTTFYEGPNKVNVDDPESDRGRRPWDPYTKHDYTCGHVARRIWSNVIARGALGELVDRSKRLLMTLAAYIVELDASGRPKGSTFETAFVTLDCCRQGRHRAGLFNYCRGY